MKRKPIPANLALDDHLVEEAKKLGGHRTKKDAVTAALDEYVRRRRQRKILALCGKIEYNRDYDYKRLRGARRG